jgi:hypothetical protein
MLGIYDRLFPNDEKGKKKWRTTVGNAIFALIFFATFTTTAMIWDIPKLGSLAWGADVDKKISEAVKPIEAKMTSMEATLNQTSSATKQLLAKLAVDQIDQLVKRRCKSQDEDEITYLSKEIRRYQDDYRTNRGEVYPAPTCEEIGFKERTR